jgi:hypothetical protein
VGYYNQCTTEGHPKGPHVHVDETYKHVYNFEQFGCSHTHPWCFLPHTRNYAHSVIKVYTRSWRDRFRKRYFLRCYHCNGKWELTYV